MAQGAREDVGGAARHDGEHRRLREGPACSSPLTTSFTVPSPPSETTRSIAVVRRLRCELAGVPPVARSRATSTFSSLARAPSSTSRVLAVVVVAAGLTTTSARMTVRLTSARPGSGAGPDEISGRSLAVENEQAPPEAPSPPGAAGCSASRPRLGPTGRGGRRPTRPPLRRAALAVGVEALLLGGVAVYLLVADRVEPVSVGRALAEVVYFAMAAARWPPPPSGCRGVVVGARPVVVLQILLGLLAYTGGVHRPAARVRRARSGAGRVTLYLLATPEARSAFQARRRPRPGR